MYYNLTTAWLYPCCACANVVSEIQYTYSQLRLGEPCSGSRSWEPLSLFETGSYEHCIGILLYLIICSSTSIFDPQDFFLRSCLLFLLELSCAKKRGYALTLGWSIPKKLNSTPWLCNACNAHSPTCSWAWQKRWRSRLRCCPSKDTRRAFSHFHQPTFRYPRLWAKLGSGLEVPTH